MSESASHALQSHPERRVRIADIRRELDAIWEDGNRALTSGQVVTRACMSNLVIYCDDGEQSWEVSRAIPDIVLVHPSRVILLTGTAEAGQSGIEVYVSGHYRDLSSGWQVCAEQIRVVADAATAQRLPSVARSQIIGDLPTTLWWASRQPPPFAGKLFSQLARISDQIIYDSFAWKSPTKGLQAMSRWVAAESSDYVIYNLAWRRLKHWRSLLGQVLDPAVQPSALARVAAIDIEHGPHAVAMAALLVGWLASSLGWQVRKGKVVPGTQTEWQFDIGGRQVPVVVTRLPDGPAAPVRVRWVWRGDDGEQRAVFAALGGDRLGVVASESDLAVSVIPAPQASLGLLVSAQMAHRSRDRVFERALKTGNNMISVLP